MLSFAAKIARERAKLEQRDADPLGDKVASVTRGIEAISTNALLDLIGLPNTTGNARGISKTMRSLGYVPIKSRRLVRGGWSNAGWRWPGMSKNRHSVVGHYTNNLVFDRIAPGLLKELQAKNSEE